MKSTLSLSGALTIAAGQTQRQLLLAATQSVEAGQEFGLDMSGVDAFDSAGVQLLLSLRKTLDASRSSLCVLTVSTVVKEVICAYGLENLMHRDCA